ncbi:MAG: YfbM family protein [Candidatus Obscuribacterales bacterium]|nr:YfbM family protein [Candidatus Obscuribacterales bacterium]
MSMCAYLESVSQRKLKKLLANPEAIHDIIWSDTHDEENSGFFELQESWQTVHFLLTGTAWDVDEDNPLTQTVLGGQEIGPDAFGYGPARFMTADQVKKIAESLKSVDLNELKSKYSQTDFSQAELYAFDGGNFEEVVAILVDYLDGLSEFYAEAAANGDAVLTYIQ